MFGKLRKREYNKRSWGGGGYGPRLRLPPPPPPPTLYAFGKQSYRAKSLRHENGEKKTDAINVHFLPTPPNRLRFNSVGKPRWHLARTYNQW